LRRRILISVIASVACAGLILSGVAHLLWSYNVARLEQYAVRRDVVQAQNALRQTLGALDAVVVDRAFSDATSRFVSDHSPDYVKAFLPDEVFTSLRINLIAVVDLTGKVVYGRTFDPDQGKGAPLPESLRSHFSPEDLLLHHRLGDLGLQGVILTPEGPLLVAARPILSSRRQGPSRGTLVMGRYFDEDEGERLGKLIDRPVSIIPYSDMAERPGTDAAIQALTTDGVLVGPVHEQRTVGYGLVKDLYGQPALVLSVSGPRTFYQQGEFGMRAFLLSLLGISLVFGLTTVSVLERGVLSRLQRLTSDVARVEKGSSSTARVAVEGTDELASLARGINTMLDGLEASDLELLASERRFRDVAVNMSDWVWETDTEGRFTYTSDRISHCLGYSPEEVLGQSLMQFAPREERQALEKRLRIVLDRNEAFDGIKAHAVAKDGRSVYVEMSGVPVFDDSGEFLGHRGVGKDITHRRMAEDAERLAAVGQLAAGVAHEFNNVLAAFSVSAEMALMRDDRESYRRSAELIRRYTERGAKICSNLLRFARPEKPKLGIVRIENCIEAALAMGLQETATTDITVLRDYQTGDARVRADTDKLEQVFLNLVINACHAMPHGGILTVSTSHEPSPGGAGGIRVSIADTGTGIRPEHLPRVFEPFFTTKGSLGGGDVPGTGLGLSVVHGIIAAHGGSISVKSELGVGTEFEIKLRAADSREDGPEVHRVGTDALRSISPDGGEHSVLVADDEETIREFVGDALAMRGYAVSPVGSAHDAIRALQSGSYDLVITDYLMPGGGAEAVFAAIADLGLELPVLVITGKDDSDVDERLSALGADGCLRKPFGLDDLLSAADHLLGVEEAMAADRRAM